MDQAQATTLVILLMSSIATVVASLVKQEHWPDAVNYLLAVALASIGGILVLLWTGGFAHIGQPGNYAVVIASIISVSQTIYQTIYKGKPEQTIRAAVYKDHTDQSAVPSHTPRPRRG